MSASQDVPRADVPRPDRRVAYAVLVSVLPATAHDPLHRRPTCDVRTYRGGEQEVDHERLHGTLSEVSESVGRRWATHHHRVRLHPITAFDVVLYIDPATSAATPSTAFSTTSSTTPLQPGAPTRRPAA